MRILIISALDLPDLVSIYPQAAEGVEAVRSKLKEAGFDVNRGFGVYKGVNSFNYLFTQEEQEPINK